MPAQPKAQPAADTRTAEPQRDGEESSAGIDALTSAGLIEVNADGSLGLSGGGKGRQSYTIDDMRAASRLTHGIPWLHQAPPPKVREAMPNEERIQLLDRAYRAGHERVLRREYWNPKRGKGRTDAETRSMLAAAAALLAEGVCPYAWSKFSFMVWRDVMKKKNAPSTRWIWSEARIREHAGWCWDYVGSVATGWPMASAARKELIHRVERVRGALGFGRPTDAVVSSILPESEWQRLVAQTEREQTASLRDEQRRILNGEWVWG